MLFDAPRSRPAAGRTIPVLLFGLAAVLPVRAITMVATSGNSLVLVDPIANTTTTLFTAPSTLDSVVFVNGKYVFTLLSGTIGTFTPGSGGATLATGFSQPRDLVVDPGSATITVSDYYNGLYRVNLTTGASTPLGGIFAPNGLTYAGSRLFVCSNNNVLEINPTTGSVLNTSPTMNQPDGLTYDPATGLLWASDYNDNGIYSLTLSLTNLTLHQAGNIATPDGLEADGAGNIWVASQNNRIYQYAPGTDTLTPRTPFTSLDDLAPLTGLGATPQTTSVPALSGWGLALLGALLAAVASRGLARRASV